MKKELINKLSTIEEDTRRRLSKMISHLFVYCADDFTKNYTSNEIEEFNSGQRMLATARVVILPNKELKEKIAPLLHELFARYTEYGEKLFLYKSEIILFNSEIKATMLAHGVNAADLSKSKRLPL